MTLKEQKHLFEEMVSCCTLCLNFLTVHGARKRGGIGFSYRPAVLHRLAESESIPGLLKASKIPPLYTSIQAVNRIPKGFFNGITYPVIDIYQRNFYIYTYFFIFLFKRKSGKTKQRNKRGNKPDKYPENL